jgi:neutral amino acid transport system permease protein
VTVIETMDLLAQVSAPLISQQLAQLIVNGIAVGCIIALAAVGLTLTYGILRLANFAHGDFLTLGAYFTLLANSLGLNIWLALF